MPNLLLRVTRRIDIVCAKTSLLLLACVRACRVRNSQSPVPRGDGQKETACDNIISSGSASQDL